jgi:hypothetical protein
MKIFSALPVILLLILTAGTSLQAQKAPDLFQEGHISEIRLTIRQADWSRVLDSMKIYGEGMIVGAAEIDGLKYPNVGIRYRGQTSYTYEGKKNPFLIKLDYIHPEQQHQGYPALTLSTALRDPSYLREYLGFAIARDYMDAPKANFCKLFINNEYHGLYINIEPVDKGFLQRRMADRWSSLFKCSPKENKDLGPEHCRKGTFANLSFEEDANCYLFNYTLKEGEGWQDLIELTRILEQEPQRAEEVLDVDATLWMLAFNNVLANLSSYTGRYSSNFYLYQGTDGRFVPVVWDLNLAFGSFKNTGIGSDLSSRDMEKLDPFLHRDNPAKPLIKALLQQDLYQRIYAAHIRQIINDHFRDDRFLNRARQLQKSIQSAVAQEKFGYYTLEEFNKSLDKTIGSKTKIPGLASFMESRSVFLRKHESLRFVTPEVVTVDLAKRPVYAQETVESFNFMVTTARQTRQVRLYYRFSPDEPFQSQWLDVKPHEGLEAGQDHFAGSVTPPQGAGSLEYYLMLSSNAAVSFYPERYRTEPNKARLEDLN